MKIALLVFNFFSILCSAESTIENLGNSKQWKNLLHYEKRFFIFPERSLADGGDFFFSDEGRSDPVKELVATIDALKENKKIIGPLKQTPLCAFPARKKFIEKKLGLKFKNTQCKQLNEFKKRMSTDSISLIYSTAYPENPGSMFGHTFLRIKSNHQTKLLDIGISYSAFVPKGEDGAVYMLMGLMGGYRGYYSVLPYYVKVNEYNFSENRDLWEYELNLNSEEIELLILHLWELETTTWFDYYFFDENCSYQINAAIEAVKPEWNVTNFGLHVIPGESVKSFTNQKGAVSKVHFRPSLGRRVSQRIDSLSDSQKNLFEEVIQYKADPLSLNDPDLLQALIEYFRYQRLDQKEKFSKKDQQTVQKIRVQISKIKSTAKKIEFTHNGRPDFGHHPYRLGIGYGSTNQFNFIDFHLKFAYHDLYNRDLGYLPFTQIDFPWVTLRYDIDSQALNLERFQFFRITSLTPWTRFKKSASWAAEAALVTPKDDLCIDCTRFQLEGGYGLSFRTEPMNFTTALLGTLRVEAGKSLPEKVRGGPGIRILALAAPASFYKIGADLRAQSDLFQGNRPLFYFPISFTQSLHFNAWSDIRAEYQAWVPGSTQGTFNRQWKIQAHFYF